MFNSFRKGAPKGASSFLAGAGAVARSIYNERARAGSARLFARSAPITARAK